MPSAGLLDAFCPFLPVPGCHGIRARRSERVFALWEAWEKEAGQECPVPFWAEVWPGAQLLSRFLLENPEIVRGKEVIEIGCGGAVASIAAWKAGALGVIANDIDPAAIRIARENAESNGAYLRFDGENRIESGSSGTAEVVLCSDFFYTKGESLALSGWMDVWRRRSMTILIGDGGRPFVPADYREILREEWMDVDSDLEGKEKRFVRILRY